MKITFDDVIGTCLMKTAKPAQMVGIELEYENYSARDTFHEAISNNTYWQIHGDDSLRNHGIEIVSVPLKPHQLDVALQHLQAALDTDPGLVANHRCGYHVHLNFTGMTWADLFKTMVYSCLLEPYMFADFAPNRDQSHFCVPTWANTVLTESIHKSGLALREGLRVPGAKSNKDWRASRNYLGGLLADGPMHQYPLPFLMSPKYSAMNVGAISKFGTVEYRLHPGTKDVNAIRTFAELLLRIQKEAMKYTSPDEIVCKAYQFGVNHLLERVNFIPLTPVPQDILEDAMDTATLIAGHNPVHWSELSWEMK